jgi:Restriction endonuclease
MSTQSDLDPTTLKRELDQLESEAAGFEIERASRARTVARLRRRSRYLRLARWFRAPASTWTAYPVVVFAVGPVAIGVVTFILLSLIFRSWLLPVGGLLVGSLGGAALLASLLYRPSDELLPSAIEETDAKLDNESALLHETVAAIAQLNRRLAFLHQQRRELATSDKLQRAMLLQRDWKAMRGSEWEDYIVEVCRTLGANVQRAEAADVRATAPTAGPRGVIRRLPTTVFVTFSPRRIALAAVSEINPFHAAAVRQIIDELAQKGCDELGIITNARLTAGSKEYARSRRCTLVGADEFPDFVLGKSSI